MIMMKCVAAAPCRLLGYGDFIPGINYPLPDALARELIATRDPNWEEANAGGDPNAGASGDGAAGASVAGSGAAGENHSKNKRRK